jgi:ABC-type glycerol-3-phosphate transport system permease component
MASTHRKAKSGGPLAPFIYLILIGYTIIVVYPMFWLFTTALKDDQSIFLHPFQLPDFHHLQFENFTNAWTKGHFGQYFFNMAEMKSLRYSSSFSSTKELWYILTPYFLSTPRGASPSL